MKIKGINYDFKEIFDAWLSASRQTELTKSLANSRYDVCIKCEHRRPLIKNNKWSEICNKCGCPLNKKIFSKIYNSCPLKKWEDVDVKYIKNLEDKSNKTII